MDLTPLIQNDKLDLGEYIQGFIQRLSGRQRPVQEVRVIRLANAIFSMFVETAQPRVARCFMLYWFS